jgi:site-specific recombinase XerC
VNRLALVPFAMGARCMSPPGSSSRPRRTRLPTAKLRLAAIRHLFDWLVKGHVLPLNPAASVRGPRHVVRKGQTPMLEPKEARKLLDSVDISRSGSAIAPCWP